MASPIFKLAQKESKDPKRCKKIDAMRLKKYIGCFIYQNHHLPIDEFMRKAKAPVEHMFNSHEWCWAKQLDDKQLELTTAHMKRKHDEDQLRDSDSDSDSFSHSSWSTCSDSDVQDGGDDEGDDSDVSWNPPVNCVESDSDDEEEEDFGLDEDELKECSFF